MSVAASSIHQAVLGVLKDIQEGQEPVLVDAAIPRFDDDSAGRNDCRSWLDTEVMVRETVTVIHRITLESVCRRFPIAGDGIRPLIPTRFSAAAVACVCARPNLRQPLLSVMSEDAPRDAADVVFIHDLLEAVCMNEESSTEAVTENWELIQRSPLTRLIYLDRLTDNRGDGGGLKSFLFGRRKRQKPSLDWTGLPLLARRDDFHALNPLLQWFLAALDALPDDEQSFRNSALESLVHALELHRKIPGLPRTPSSQQLEDLLILHADA